MFPFWQRSTNDKSQRITEEEDLPAWLPHAVCQD